MARAKSESPNFSFQNAIHIFTRFSHTGPPINTCSIILSLSCQAYSKGSQGHISTFNNFSTCFTLRWSFGKQPLLPGQFRGRATICNAWCRNLALREVKFPVEEVFTPPVNCLIYEAYSEWFLGEIAACQANTAEAISLAKELKDVNALAHTLYLGGILAF